MCPTCEVIGRRPLSIPEQRWVSRLDTPAVSTGQRGVWGRCPADGLLHLLTARALLGIKAQGCAVAYCGALLVTENLVLRGRGTPCPTCLVGSTS